MSVRCFCGRYRKNKPGGCSLEIRVYREGSLLGWEHY